MKNKENYLNELYKAYEYSTAEFDKSLTLISCGILGVSFAFIEKIVPIASAECKDLLINAWVILGIAIGISLIAHYLNIVFIKIVIKNYNSKNSPLEERVRKRSEIAIQLLNLITFLLTTIGTILIFIFIKKNISI
ncbi:MAG: hypothetical protein KL787_03415 [Taibaiella sp.]|nr:hypothetical protein [Taibaiella sp.]